MDFERKSHEQKVLRAAEILHDESMERNLTFALPDEKDKDGNVIEGACSWVACNGVEAKFFVPEKNDNATLVLFEPGLPGDSVAWFEHNQVRTLIESGYSVFVMRHLGTRTDTENADALIHCPDRVAKGVALETKVIGEQKEYNLAEIAQEPALAVNAIGKYFDNIVQIGHSAGALHNAYAINHIQPELRDKIRNFISLLGYLGGREERTQNFSDLKGYYEYCREFIRMGDAEENTKLVQQIFDEVHKNGIPDNIMVTQVNSPQDEYIPISSAKKFQDFLGRGLSIVDQTQFEADFHDLKNLQPETLLRLLKMHYPKSRHSVTVNQREIKR